MTMQDPSPDHDRAADLGERLATWLEGLHLGPHLAEAGLPTFERDAAGRAQWTDPNTLEPLSLVQLEQLDALLHRDGSEPQHAVPVALLQLARQARLREELLATAWFTYDTLAEARGETVDALRFAVTKAANAHQLLVVPADERALVPAFQLDADLDPRDDLAPVLQPLLAAGIDPWRAWAWLTQPAGLMAGLVPEQAAADPETATMARRAGLALAKKISDNA
ncbi:hypothetical protein [Nocardioides pacificus]